MGRSSRCASTSPSTAARREVNGVWEGESLHECPARAPRPAGIEERLPAGRVLVVLRPTSTASLLRSCPALAGQAEGSRGGRPSRASPCDGELHRGPARVRRSRAVQCGFCTLGPLVASSRPAGAQPTRRATGEIREALAGNLCRCTGYEKILDAVRLAAERLDDGPRPARGRDGRRGGAALTATVIDGGAIATLDGAGADLGTATSSSTVTASSPWEPARRSTLRRDARRIPTTRHARHPRPRQLPPPPLPMG